MKAIKEKDKLIKEAEKKLTEAPKVRKKVMQSITFEEAVNRTIDYLVDLGENTDAIDLNTVYDYYDRVKMYIYDFFPKETKLSTINENKIKEFVGYMFNRERKDGTGLLGIGSVEKTYSALSWIIRYCSEISDPPLLEENYLNKIIFKTLVPKGRKTEKKNKKVSDLQTINTILDVVNNKANIRLKTIVNIFMDVGCRPEECLGFKWIHINLGTGKVNYNDAVTASISKKNNAKHGGTRVKGLKSKNSYRDNYLTAYTITCLKQLKQFKKALGLSVEDNDHIFTIWSDNTVLSPISLEDEYKDFKKKHNLPNVIFYEFRHNISNLLQEEGVPIKDIAEYLGNSPQAIQKAYTGIREESEYKIHKIITEKSRCNQHKSFDIDSIVYILNSKGGIENEKVYELLDFVANKKVSIDDTSWVIENAKKLILEQHPMLSTFCGDDENIIKAKLDTYKVFNSNNIELIQNPNYYFPSVKI